MVTDDKPSASTMNAIEVEFADEFAKRTSGKIHEVSLPLQAQYTNTMLSNQAVISGVANSIIGEQILEHALLDLHKSGVTTAITLLVEGNPATCIQDQQQRYDCDTIVLGCRGVGRFKEHCWAAYLRKLLTRQIAM